MLHVQVIVPLGSLQIYHTDIHTYQTDHNHIIYTTTFLLALQPLSGAYAPPPRLRGGGGEQTATLTLGRRRYAYMVTSSKTAHMDTGRRTTAQHR